VFAFGAVCAASGPLMAVAMRCVAMGAAGCYGTAHSRPPRRTGAPARRSAFPRSGRRALFRKWNELVVVPGHLGKTSSLPISLGLLNAVARGGDEVPEDIARTVHSRAAEQQQARALGARTQHRGAARMEHQHAARREMVAGDLDLAVDHI